jgi:hypothetical protein
VQLLKKKYEQTTHVESIVGKLFVLEYYIVKLNGFVRNLNSKLSEAGLVLKRKADALIRHDKNIRKLADAHPDETVKRTLRNKENGAIGASNLIAKFANLYENHQGFKDELIVCLLEAVIAKVEGHANIALAPMAANFFSALHSTSAKGFNIVSANLWGPSKRAIQVRNAAGRSPEPFICYNKESIKM